MRRDAAAFEQLISETHRDLRAWICGLGLTPDEADDVALAACAAFWREPALRPDGVTPEDWLCQLARDLALDRLRSAGAMRRAQLAEVLAGVGAPVADQPGIARLEALRAALDRLPTTVRTLVETVQREGVDAETAGARLGLNPAAARSTLARARRELRADLVNRLRARA